MAAAARARPEDYFNAEEWRSLSERSTWRGLWLVAHCWGVIAIAMLMGTIWPLTIPFAVMIIGTRQLGLFVLMHDAAHATLHVNRRVNDWVGTWFCSAGEPVWNFVCEALHDERLQEHVCQARQRRPPRPGRHCRRFRGS
jgi:fatty acid desaturase